MSEAVALTGDEIDAIFARAEEERETKAAAALAQWGVGGGGSWSADLAQGLIRFETPLGRFVGDLQFIGSFNRADGSWIWGWDHPTPFPDTIAAHARKVREFGEHNGLVALTQRRIEADEFDGWAFADLACHLADAGGVYRAPSGEIVTFLTFSNVMPEG